MGWGASPSRLPRWPRGRLSPLWVGFAALQAWCLASFLREVGAKRIKGRPGAISVFSSFLFNFQAAVLCFPAGNRPLPSLRLTLQQTTLSGSVFDPVVPKCRLAVFLYI